MESARICYAGLSQRMRPRTFLFITASVLCHIFAMGQALTNALPPAQSGTRLQNAASAPAALPDDPGQEAMPIAQPQPGTAAGVPVSWRADRQTWTGRIATLYGVTEFRYRGYLLSADKIIYNQDTSEVDVDGHIHLTGGPEDIDITAASGTLRLNEHTARFFNVTGTMGLRSAARSVVYSTANPFIIHARVLLETGEGSYRVVDGSMTNCKLPHPDWELLSHSIDIANGHASTTNTIFKFIGIPLFYIPYLRHPVDENGRQSGFFIPELSNYSSIAGYMFGEQFYWAINRSMDMRLGTEYFSRRGWAPKGDFRYRGSGLDHAIVNWSALFDRGVNVTQTTGPQAGQTVLVNQGGVDITADLRRDFTPQTRVAGITEYLSSYTYRLVFSPNYWQAVSSEVKSDLSLTHVRNGRVPSADFSRLQTFDGATEGDEARILHLPNIRYDVLDSPLAGGPVYWGLGSGLSQLSRAEPGFHAHNEGRIDLYPHVSLPLLAGGWSIVPEGALRGTFYSGSQVPDLTGANDGIPTVSHDPLHRTYGEAEVDVHPPALERDFTLDRWHTSLRHVIEPEVYWHYVGGIGSQARNVLLVDTDDIETDTDEVGYSLMQRFYLRPSGSQPCADTGDDASGKAEAADVAGGDAAATCTGRPREWASWQLAQRYYLDPNFGGALIPGRRNVFSSTLDLTGVSFLTEPRNLSPLLSRMRFEAIPNLRAEWDLDYDPKAGRIGASNVYAGFSHGIATVGLGHAVLNAVDQQGTAATLLQSQQLEPFVEFGKQNRGGFNLAANGGYDFVLGQLQYGGVQAVYNWDCCGLTVGYRRFQLGTSGPASRDETEYLWGFTLANFGTLGDVRTTNTVFLNPSAVPSY
jgi:LPS-assembly protein